MAQVVADIQHLARLVGGLPGRRRIRTGRHPADAEHDELGDPGCYGAFVVGRNAVLKEAELAEQQPELALLVRSIHRRCVDLYWSAAYIDLTTLPRVGIGSICRRQGTAEAGRIIRVLRRAGLHRLHLFGFSTLGLAAHADLLTDVDTCDSMAWSDAARKLRRPALPQCELRRRHINCANCLSYALRWRAQLLAAATPLTTPSTGVAA